MRNLSVAVLAGSLTLGLFFAGCHSQHSTDEQSKETTVSSLDNDTPAQSVDLLMLKPSTFQKKLKIPGELTPFETVQVFPKVEGFIQQVYVDRGTQVSQGQVLARLVAPELEAKIAEARSKVNEADAADAEALAKYTSAQGVYARLSEAAKVPGVISENELANAKMAAQAAKAHVQALQGARMASRANVKSLQEIKGYLQIRSPIDGVVSKRNLHPGALVGPSGAGAAASILEIEQIRHLRLLVSVPERYYGEINLGKQVPFHVSAYPDRIFTGIISRPAYMLDEKNRTETVELDVKNPDKALSPGMYAEVEWPVQRKDSTFMVPSSAIVMTAERTFVERIDKGQVEWVDVRKGFVDGDHAEIFGDLHDGDLLIQAASDEYRDGETISPKMVAGSR